jgi:hypothetical protein
MSNKPEADIFAYNPWLHHGDPGPEIYQVVSSLPAERQRQVAAVVSEAVGAIAAIKGGAYAKISGILSKSGQG